MSSKKKTDKDTTIQAIAGNIAIDKTPYMQNTYASNEVLRKLSEELKILVDTRANCGPECTGGYAAELHHKYTFLADALKKGHKKIEVNLGPRGGYGSKGSADLTILDNGIKVSEAGLKYRAKVSETTFDQSNVADYLRQRIFPSDQYVEGRELANKRASTGTLKAVEYADTAKNATDTLKYKDIESNPFSKQESIDIVKDTSKYSTQAFKNDIATGAKGGAIAGAAISGVVSLATNARACIKSEKDLGDAAEEVITQTASGGLKGAAIGAGSAAVRRGLVKAGANGLAKGSAPVVIVGAAFEAGVGITKEIKKAAQGEQGIGECVLNSAGHTASAATKGGGAYAGAELGAFICVPLGPIGIAAGALIGGTLGYMGAGAIVDGIKSYFISAKTNIPQAQILMVA